MRFILRIQSKYFLIFVLAIICYSFPLLFSFLFNGSFLASWKQLIWILLLIIAFSLRSHFDKNYKQFIRHINISIFLLIVSAVFSLFLNFFNLQRVVFGIWVYLAGLPFLVFPYLVFKTGNFLIFKRLIIFLSIVVSLGLILDHLLGIFTIINISAGTEFSESKGEENRATFLFESPTALVNFLNALVLFVFIFFLSTSGFFKRAFYFVLIAILLLAAYYTGSRQVVLASFFISFVGLIIFIRQLRGVFNNLLWFAIFVFLSYGGYYFFTFVESESLIANRLSDTDIKEDSRSELWLEGLSQFYPENALNWIFGNGLSSTMGQKAVVGEVVHTHYESAFLATFYELGIIGWFIILFPVIKFFIKVLYKDTSSVRYLISAYIVSFFFIFFIAPGGLHFTSLMSIFLVGGFVYNYEKFLISLESR